MKYNTTSFGLLCGLLTIGNILAMDENQSIIHATNEQNTKCDVKDRINGGNGFFDLDNIEEKIEEIRGRSLTKNPNNSRETSASQSSSRSRSQSPTQKSTTLSTSSSHIPSPTKIFDINGQKFYCSFTKVNDKSIVKIVTSGDTLLHSSELDFSNKSPHIIEIDENHKLAIQQNLDIVLHESIILSPLTSPEDTPPTSPRNNNSINDNEAATDSCIHNGIITTVTELTHEKPKNARILPIKKITIKNATECCIAFNGEHQDISIIAPYKNIPSEITQEEWYFSLKLQKKDDDSCNYTYHLSVNKEIMNDVQKQIKSRNALQKELMLSPRYNASNSIAIGSLSRNGFKTSNLLIYEKPENVNTFIITNITINDQDTCSIYYTDSKNQQTSIELNYSDAIVNIDLTKKNYLYVEQKQNDNIINTMAFELTKEAIESIKKDVISTQKYREKIKLTCTSDNGLSNQTKIIGAISAFIIFAAILYNYDKLPSISSLLNKILGHTSN